MFLPFFKELSTIKSPLSSPPSPSSGENNSCAPFARTKRRTKSWKSSTCLCSRHLEESNSPPKSINTPILLYDTVVNKVIPRECLYVVIIVLIVLLICAKKLVGGGGVCKRLEGFRRDVVQRSM